MSKPAKSSRIAKKIIDQEYIPGSGWRAYELKIHQETAGALRFFVEVPEHIDKRLSNADRQNPPRSDVQLQGQIKDIGPRMYGRDPDAIVAALKRMHLDYEEKYKDANAEFFILVDIATHKTRRSSFDSKEIELKLSTTRYARIGNEWFDVERDGGVGHRCWSSMDEGTLLPYTEDLWAQLEAMKASMRAGIERLEALVGNKQEFTKALAGGQLSLAGPGETA